ncbi:rRNA methyltransferase spb1 [Aspergillus aculeatinus CBS 121060]|uniref:AdoMet-dependent rRNA methyltransferase spb1 n=1 Tax=Aspergillus aculeatinus CBS 121060 TaxID=1448322 RepID=A0ACD1H709_9EURO|nr:putative AdoMet-dependent rRNA methyltransferase spb1 [Aspergillus aculeatinus CBS 121060]RAH69590.1 putative AdoMet-dependent rRNA methyltransferase spb1 [Aspergillus aculeatinus CBS 121060]
MAIQKKHGKGRLDKWYRLAKEKGYRARSAFKLVQLNKKYGFLQKSKVLIDLCAAPGGWCQVAAECMPAQSIIVGVDLAPIKPIPRVISFQADITTDKCRATLRQHLKHWKADTVLHDGAPNVGTAWAQDAFSQSELVLQSMKLATEFLAEGGTFVTKVFRSKDYNPLLWVFKQLFTSVEATKPPSSRNVSAEIFVVCRGYKAPKHLDPKFLDPKHVFAELADPTPNNEAKVFNPEKKKRKREGYEEGDYTQFKECSVSEFINTTDPIAILGSYNKLSFTQTPGGDLALATLDRLEETTDEIRKCCDDLKVLGKKEFRNLLKWRLKVREKFGLVTKKGQQQKGEEAEEVAEIAPMDEELAIQEELLRLREKETSKMKRERRKENEKKRKEIVRMQMHMTTPMDIGMEQLGPGGDDATFSIKPVDRNNARDVIAAGKEATIESDSEDSDDESDIEESDEEGDRLERELDTLYERYQERKEDKDTKLRAKKARKGYEADEWDGFSDENKGDSDDEEEEETSAAVNGVQAPKSGSLSNHAALFFDQDMFEGLEDIDDVEDEEEEEEDDYEEEDEEDEEEDDSEEDSEEDGAVEVDNRRKAKQAKNSKQKAEDSEDEEPVQLEDPRKANGQLDIDIITAEAMALAQQMATGEKKQNDVVDDGFNRYAFRDVDGLPEWFLDDEGKHSAPNRPITKAAAAAIKEKWRAINARPIKKVMEAKGRKKFKAAQRLEKLRKKSALLADDEALSERDKAQSIAKLMARATKKKPKTQVKLVVAKGANRGISGRPKGVKGRYKIVDSRMKKDIRAQKRVAKKKQK